MANKRSIVDPPPFTPLRYGLLPAAIDRTPEAPNHWRTGVTWQSHCPDAGGTYDPCLVEARNPLDPDSTAVTGAPLAPNKVATTDFFLRGATPFTVYTRFDCSPVGFWEKSQELALEALTRVEGNSVERIFATGVAPTQGGAAETVFPHLQEDTPLIDDTNATLQTAAQVITGQPVDIVEALGRIEDALGDCYHGRGVIHVPAVLGADLAANTLVVRAGATLETMVGHRVAVGAGYPGASPSGVITNGVAWIYATGAVFYYRSEPRVGQLISSFNRSVDTVEMLAERTYVFGWDCCHLAIPVQLGGVITGGFGVGT